jgi:protein TonB
MVHRSVWKITVSIVISMGLHGLLLAWFDLNIADETSSTGGEQQPIEITLVAGLPQRLPTHTKAEPLLVTEAIAEEVVAYPPSSKILSTSEKLLEPISESVKEKVLIQKEAKQIRVQRAAVVESTSLADTLAEDTGSQSPFAIASMSIPKMRAPATETKYSKRVKENYLADLRIAISRYKYYPARAWRMRKQGNVWVEFFIYRDGRIDQVTIRKSSGESMLDRAAMQSVLKLGRYLPFPERIDAAFFSVAVPMSYMMH